MKNKLKRFTAIQMRLIMGEKPPGDWWSGVGKRPVLPFGWVWKQKSGVFKACIDTERK
jgi:hypothetical protein